MYLNLLEEQRSAEREQRTRDAGESGRAENNGKVAGPRASGCVIGVGMTRSASPLHRALPPSHDENLKARRVLTDTATVRAHAFALSRFSSFPCASNTPTSVRPHAPLGIVNLNFHAHRHHHMSRNDFILNHLSSSHSHERQLSKKPRHPAPFALVDIVNTPLPLPESRPTSDCSPRTHPSICAVHPFALFKE